MLQSHYLHCESSNSHSLDDAYTELAEEDEEKHKEVEWTITPEKKIIRHYWSAAITQYKCWISFTQIQISDQP